MQKTDLETLFPDAPDSTCLLVGCRRGDYSATAIARAVEDCDAHVLNLNVTSLQSDDSSLVVSLRVNRRNADSVVRSLERYGYNVLEVDRGVSDGDEADRTEMHRRIEQLLHYLNI